MTDTTAAVAAVNGADLVWVLAAACLVMLMTPAVGLFYGGMVQRKNLLSTMMLSFAILLVISLQWVMFGYSLAFGPDWHNIVGDLSWVSLRGVGLDVRPEYAATLPHLAFMLFQMKFAVITPALITGAFVERIRFSSFLLFTLIWSTLVYCPIVHWIWSPNGWLRNLGALDFAGGTVIHITAGVAALAVAMVVRPRKNFGAAEHTPPGNIPMTLLGVAFLWFGWFGFNGGSALAADGLAVRAIVNTNVAAAAAGLVWMLVSWRQGRPSVVGTAIGSVCGLVAITPACGYVDITASMVIGMVASLVSYFFIKFRSSRMRIDETLDVWACHGMAGTWGALATGIFASSAINPAGADGLIYGNWSLFWAQCLSVAVAWVFTFGMTYVIARLINHWRSLSVPEEAEELGLDISQHGEQAHVLI